MELISNEARGVIQLTQKRDMNTAMFQSVIKSRQLTWTGSGLFNGF